jgi:uncharacterized heparinase superfamily protein
MTAKKNSTLKQRVDCIYRRQITMDQQLGALIALVANVPRFRETIKTLADHVLRLTREKEILLKREINRLALANAYIAEPLKAGSTNGEVPVLADLIDAFAVPIHAHAAEHAYDDKGRRCQICWYLKEAIEAGGLSCAGPTKEGS